MVKHNLFIINILILILFLILILILILLIFINNKLVMFYYILLIYFMIYTTQRGCLTWKFQRVCLFSETVSSWSIWVFFWGEGASMKSEICWNLLFSVLCLVQSWIPAIYDSTRTIIYYKNVSKIEKLRSCPVMYSDLLDLLRGGKSVTCTAKDKK
jgi:hypothetical protein